MFVHDWLLASLAELGIERTCKLKIILSLYDVMLLINTMSFVTNNSIKCNTLK